MSVSFRWPSCLRLILTLPIFLLTVFSARAEMTAVTVAASVRSFDLKTVVIQVNKKRVRIPRSLVKDTDLREGEAIFVTFHGDEIKMLFSDVENRNENARDPASLHHK